MMNRAQRRAYDKKYKNSPMTDICPVCKHRSRFFTTKHEGHVVVRCEVCGGIARQGEDIDKYLPAGIYIPTAWMEFETVMMPLLIKMAAEKEKRKNGTTGTDQSNSGEDQSTDAERTT